MGLGGGRLIAPSAVAESTKAALAKQFGKCVATEIVPLTKFWPAEGYHQNYDQKNGLRDKYYRNGCGRADRVKGIWGDEAGGLSKHSE